MKFVGEVIENVEDVVQGKAPCVLAKEHKLVKLL